MSSGNHVEIVFEGGTATTIYHDGLVGLLNALGQMQVSRASAVEYDQRQQGWMVDLSPTFPGVVLGPFLLRQDALDAEVAYLYAHL